MDKQNLKSNQPALARQMNLLFALLSTLLIAAQVCAQGFTISGRVTGANLNASIRFQQNGSTTFIATDSNGNWSHSSSSMAAYEVSAFTTQPGTRVSPPARAGGAVSMGGLDFHIADGFQYKQISGRVTSNGSGLANANHSHQLSRVWIDTDL